MRTYKDKDLDYNFNLITGLYLRKKREALNMTLDDLAKRCRTTRQNIFKYETNKSRIKLDMYISICYALQLNPGEAYREIVELTKEKGLEG